LRAVQLGLGKIDVVLRLQLRVGFDLRFLEMRFSILFYSLFVNPRELPGLQNIIIALRDFEDQVQIDELLLIAGRCSFEATLLDKSTPPSEVEKILL
jgi:hypothetical protein